MAYADPHALWTKLTDLRTELADLAFRLECRGRIDAADVAMTVSARVGELCEELTTGEAADFIGEGPQSTGWFVEALSPGSLDRFKRTDPHH